MVPRWFSSTLATTRQAYCAPVKELKGFEKVYLKAGESKRVKIELPYEALCFFDDAAHAWRAEKGMFTLSIGSASDDIRATLPLELK